MNAKVTMLEAPAPEVEAVIKQEITVTDSAGRVMVLKKPGPIALLRLVRVLGDDATNQTYMAMVMPLLYLVSLDGEPVLPPTTTLQIEALVGRLDEHGYETLASAIAANFKRPDPEAERAELRK